MPAIRYIPLFGVMSLWVACATLPANAPKYSRAADPPAGYVNLYVYRIGAYPTLRTPTISIDDKTLFDPVEHSYTVVPLPVGLHRFKVDWAWDTGWPDLVFSIVLSSRPLYIKISGSAVYDGSGTWEAWSYAHDVPPAVAETELVQCCRYIGNRLRIP
jgi:hypothetical protein